LAHFSFNCCRAFLVSAFALFPSTRAPADTPATSIDSTNLIPENLSLIPESLLWDKSVTLRAGLGYKDNVPLSPSPQGSGFTAFGLDLLVFRLPLDGLDVNFNVTGDDTRFWRNPDGIYREDLFLASGRVAKSFGGGWQVGMELRGTYADQVVEELTQTNGVEAVQAIGYTLGVRPFVRRNLGSNWWAQVEAPISREWWQAPLDDLWKIGGQVLLGMSYGNRSQVSIGYAGFDIPHDDWLTVNDQGVLNTNGTKLTIWRQIAELKWEHQWDRAQHWRSITRLAFQYDQDNGGGWYNYYRYLASEGLVFRTKDWEIRGSAGISYYSFPVQTVSTPPSNKLYLTTLELSARVERRLYKGLRLFAEYSYERLLSNDASSEYVANTATGGLSWEF
jgi:hypothetical protein